MTTFCRSLLRSLAMAATLPVLAGCATYGMQEQQMAQQEDMSILHEKVRRLEGRLEGYDLAIQQLQQMVDQMRTRPTGPSTADLETLQTRLAALDNQLRALDAARQRDRQEIVDTLSTKIAALVSSSGAARGGTARPSSPPKRTANQEGYEHVVQVGETLSAIASAYNARSKDIIEANGLDRPDQLRVGQKLFIPAP